MADNKIAASNTSKPVEIGGFVVHEKHPEHGLGRVINVGSSAIRVMFQHGGLRVFRVGEPHPLKNVVTPAPADVEAIAQKEAAMASGVVETPTGVTKPAAPAPKTPKKKKKVT
jgi:hypothetical protein